MIYLFIFFSFSEPPYPSHFLQLGLPVSALQSGDNAKLKTRRVDANLLNDEAWKIAKKVMRGKVKIVLKTNSHSELVCSTETSGTYSGT